VVSILAQNQNSRGGGTKLPTFEGLISSAVKTLRFDNCLPTQYPLNWVDSTKQQAVIRPEFDDSSLVADLTINRSIYSGVPGSKWQESDDVFTLVGPAGQNYSDRVLVNDSVSFAAGGSEEARVLSVDGNIITIDRNILNTFTDLYFKRNSNSINEWFARGFSELEQAKFNNCRLSGKLNIRSSMGKLLDKDFIAFDLSNNLISEYEKNSLSRIFTGTNRKITVDLSRNLFSTSTIRTIITDAINLDKQNKFTNCQVQLYQCKIDANNKYTNLTQSDIFTTTISGTIDQTINLTRLESIYETVINSANEEVLAPIPKQLLIRVPGALVGVQYWKQRIDTRQQISEDPLGTQFKALKGIKVNFDFTYVSPPSLSNVIKRVYTGPTTRYDSVEGVFNPKTGRNYDAKFLVNDPQTTPTP
jgi:hypothetical protein